MCTPSFIRDAPLPGSSQARYGERRNPMRSRRSAREDLRLAVECLPRRTRVAMLEGIRSNDIIVGAYVDRKGGVCPMLAAHRNGGRTDFLSFAHAWDRFTRAKRARLATEREIAVLVSYLKASLLEEDLEAADLEAAIRDHQAASRRRREAEARRLGLGWLRRERELDAEAVPHQIAGLPRDGELLPYPRPPRGNPAPSAGHPT